MTTLFNNSLLTIESTYPKTKAMQKITFSTSDPAMLDRFLESTEGMPLVVQNIQRITVEGGEVENVVKVVHGDTDTAPQEDLVANFARWAEEIDGTISFLEDVPKRGYTAIDMRAMILGIPLAPLKEIVAYLRKKDSNS